MMPFRLKTSHLFTLSPSHLSNNAGNNGHIAGLVHSVQPKVFWRNAACSCVVGRQVEDASWLVNVEIKAKDVLEAARRIRNTHQQLL